MFLFSMILLILTLACGGETHHSLQPSVDKFEQLLDVKIRFPVQFTDGLRDNLVGVCYPTFPKLVLIDSNWWAENTEPHKREQLIFHELGHCALGRDHMDTPNNSGCLTSIMAANQWVSEWCYNDYYDYYINELLTGE